MKRENSGFVGRVARRALSVALATAVYGAVLAAWRSPLMAVYVAAKLPLVFLGTTAVVSVFCWMAGLLTGAGLRLGEVLDAVFTAMGVAGAVLVAVAPVVLFLVFSGAPDAGTPDEMRFAHACLLGVHILVLGGAGVMGLGSLVWGLRRHVPPTCRLGMMLSLWLVSFAVVGCQGGWMLRPLVGSPNIAVEFLREDALKGNFLESLFNQIIPHLVRKGAVS